MIDIAIPIKQSVQKDVPQVVAVLFIGQYRHAWHMVPSRDRLERILLDPMKMENNQSQRLLCEEVMGAVIKTRWLEADIPQVVARLKSVSIFLRETTSGRCSVDDTDIDSIEDLCWRETAWRTSISRAIGKIPVPPAARNGGATSWIGGAWHGESSTSDRFLLNLWKWDIPRYSQEAHFDVARWHRWAMPTGPRGDPLLSPFPHSTRYFPAWSKRLTELGFSRCEEGTCSWSVRAMSRTKPSAPPSQYVSGCAFGIGPFPGIRTGVDVCLEGHWAESPSAEALQGYAAWATQVEGEFLDRPAQISSLADFRQDVKVVPPTLGNLRSLAARFVGAPHSMGISDPHILSAVYLTLYHLANSEGDQVVPEPTFAAFVACIDWVSRLNDELASERVDPRRHLDPAAISSAFLVMIFHRVFARIGVRVRLAPRDQ